MPRARASSPSSTATCSTTRRSFYGPNRLGSQRTLTAAEIEVLRALAEGKSAAAIATETGRSVHTVRAHTRAIIAKLGSKGKVAAIAAARKAGLIP